MYRTLDADKIIDTLERLRTRIGERFPGTSLSRVCAELIDVARADQQRAARLSQPNWRLRLGIGAILAAGVALTGWLGRLLADSETPATIFGSLQGLDALTNILVVVGAGVLFLASFESRSKRNQALEDLHQLRSIVHVIDMHQLTKDPTAGQATAHSPQRSFTPFELTRYLDYCSEMLSLAAKVAALYAQHSSDPVVIDTVNDLERLTTNLSQKIWQKITLVSESSRVAYPPSGTAT